VAGPLPQPLLGFGELLRIYVAGTEEEYTNEYTVWVKHLALTPQVYMSSL
jgi:hypothetical protein